MQTSKFRTLMQQGARSLLNLRLEVLRSEVDAYGTIAVEVARSAGTPSTSGSSQGASWCRASGAAGLAWPPCRYAASSSAGASKKQRDVADAAEEDPKLIRVVLRKDVERLGRRGDLVLVKRGRMRHELYPGGYAAYATPENVSKYALSSAERESRSGGAEQRAGGLEKLLRALNRKSVIVTRRPLDSDGERFAEAGVSRRHIVEAVERQLNIRLHRSHLFLGDKIDTYGSYKVPLNLRLQDGPQVELTVHVDRKGARQQQQQAGAAATAAAAAATAAGGRSA